MNLVLTVVEITLPAFLLAGIGFAWVRMGYDFPVAFVTRLVMTIAIPALIFSSLAQTALEPSALAQIALASFLGYAVLSGISMVLVRMRGLETRTFVAPLAYGNTGNLGLPLAFFAYGNQGLDLALVVFAVSGIFTFTFGVWVTSGTSKPWKLLREPMILATLAGALFLWQGWTLPDIATRTLDLAGDLSIPLMLLTLGVAIAQLTAQNLSRSVVLSLSKWVICIGTAWGIAVWLALEPVAFGVLVLQLSTPVAVTSFLIATKYQTDSQSVAGLVLVSTLLSVITLPLTLAFLI